MTLQEKVFCGKKVDIAYYFHKFNSLKCHRSKKSAKIAYILNEVTLI